MRIAYISADHGIPVFGSKGASIHIREMIAGFVTGGHAVHLFTARVGGDAALAGTTITKVRAPTNVDGAAAGTDPDILPRLQKERRYLSIGLAIEAELEREHRKGPFNFIYERYSLWSAAGVRLARRLGIPCLIEVNAPLLVEQKTYRKLVLEREAAEIECEVFSNADRLLAVSQEVANYCMAWGGIPDRVTVNPNCVNTAVFRPDADATLLKKQAGPVVGFCGSLRPWHGLEDLASAFRLVSERRPDAHLLVVGDGPRKEWLEGYLAGANLGHRATLTGWRDHEELPSLLAAMDVAVAPYPEIDGFYFSPLKIFEYMAAGRAVVASDIGQIRDIVTSDHNGVLFQPGNVEHMADCIIRLLDDDAFRQRVGEQAAASMQSRSWNQNAHMVCNIAAEHARQLTTEAAVR